MIRSVIERFFTWENKSKVPNEEYNSEVNGEEPDDDHVTPMEDSYLSRWYANKGRNMSPLAILSLNQLTSENSDLRKLLECLYQGNITAFSENLNLFSSEQLDILNIAGQHILHLICIKKDIAALRIILNRNVKIDILDSDGMSPLHIAVIENWIEGVDELLSKGAATDQFQLKRKNSRFPWFELPIHTAARYGRFHIASLFLDKNPDLAVVNSEGNTVLHLAALSHCPQLINRLLKWGVVLKKISVGNFDGNSPLHNLMLGENLSRNETQTLECLQILLQNGANIHMVNEKGKSPLFLAARANLPLIVRSLLNAGADPTVICNDKRSILHAACKSDSHESLALLIASGKVFHLVLQVDKKGLAPFHYAVNSCSIGCCELLLENGDHLTTVDCLKRTRCSLILKNMPSAEHLLKKIFDSKISISGEDIYDPDFMVEMDFCGLVSTSQNGVTKSIVADLSISNADYLMNHPLIESFLHLKWRKIKGLFYAYFATYFFFLMVHTFYIIKTYDMDTDWSKEENVKMMKIIYWFHTILLSLIIFHSIFTIWTNLQQYLKQWETYVKIAALSISAFVVFGRNLLLLSQEEALSRNLATCSIFFTWIEFMMLLGQIPSLGLYILMFTRVSKSVTKFLLAFSPLIIAFSLAFRILFNDIETFHTYPTVFVKTLMMLGGEIDFDSIYQDNVAKMLDPLTMVTSQLFLVLFLVLVPILMANLLIGLAVSDLADLLLQGKIRRLVKQASYLESYERLIQLLNYGSTLVGSVPKKRGLLNLKKQIFPNHSYRRDSSSIPAETLQAAIAAGTKEKLDAGLNAFFKKFQNENAIDGLKLGRALQSIYEMIKEISNKEHQENKSEELTRKMSMY